MEQTEEIEAVRFDTRKSLVRQSQILMFFDRRSSKNRDASDNKMHSVC